MAELGAAAIAVSVGLAAVAVWTDLKRREIPHWVVGGLALSWLAGAVLAPEAINGRALASVVCGLAGLLVGFVLHALGWLGGGDGKLLAALALWLGPADVGLALVCTGLIGAMLTLLALTPWNSWRQRGIPCAVALVPPAAVLLVFRAIGVMG